ncbi:hypothetical protein BC830DRAFT_230664 [Chytriomyces sp. MP71]|nr:hypothetical protein BC830DRAFT_230664 [Chytriomyces sp. MP71]
MKKGGVSAPLSPTPTRRLVRRLPQLRLLLAACVAALFPLLLLQLALVARNLGPSELEASASVMTKLNATVLRPHSMALAPPSFAKKPLPRPVQVGLTIEDRLSHIYVKLASDFYYGLLPVPPGFQERLDRIRINASAEMNAVDAAMYNERLTSMRDGAIIYVEAYYLRNFTQDVLPRIKSRFVLVTGDSSVCVPNCIVNKGSTLKLATDPRLLHWYATHCQGYMRFPQRFTCMPLGIDQHRTARMDMQRAYENGIGLIDGIEQRLVSWDARPERYLLVSFQISTNKETRQHPWELFCGNQTVSHAISQVRSVSNCFFEKWMDKYEFYASKLAPSRFVISPEGYGPDCYRTYEALLLGSYPIVLTSELDVLFKDLPVLILQKWEDLSIGLMEATYENYQTRQWDFQRLYVAFWSRKFRSHLT